MLWLILSSLLFQVDQVNYYYFKTEGCKACQLQTPIVQRLIDEGFDFQIIDDDKNFEIKIFPTIIIELIDYKHQKTKQIRLTGLQSYDQLKKQCLP